MGTVLAQSSESKPQPKFPSADFQKLVIPAKAPNWQQIAAPLKIWLEDTWQVNGLRNPTVPGVSDEAWRKFVQAAVARELSLPAYPSRRELELMAMQLIGPVNEHPVAYALIGRTLSEHRLAPAALTIAYRKLAAQAGQETLAFMVACDLTNHRPSEPAKQEGDPKEDLSRFDVAVSALRRSLEKDPGWAKWDDNIIQHLLALDDAPELLLRTHEQFFQEVAAAPNVKSWVVQWLEGRHEAQKVNASVSTGYPPGSRDASRVEGEQALACYQSVLKSGTTGSVPASDVVALTLQSIGSESPVDDMLEAASAAMKVEVDSYQYHAWLLRALSPDWYGSHREMLRYGRVCLDSGRFDSFLPHRYLDVHLAIKKDLASPDDYFPNLDYSPFRQMFAGYEKEPAREPWRRHDRTLAAVVARACHQYQEAARWLAALGTTPPDPAVLEEWSRLEPWLLLGETAAFTGPRQTAAAEAEELWADPARVADCLTSYRQLAAGCTRPEEAAERRFYEKRIAALEVETQLKPGQSVPLAFPADAGIWTREGGGWRRTDDGAMETGGQVLSTFTSHLARVTPGIVLEGQLEWSDIKNFSTITIALDSIERHWDDPSYRFTFRVAQGRMKLLDSRMGMPPKYQTEMVASPRVRFRLQWLDERVKLSLDGTDVPVPQTEKSSDLRMVGNLILSTDYPDPGKTRHDARLHVSISSQTTASKSFVRIRDLRLVLP